MSVLHEQFTADDMLGAIAVAIGGHGARRGLHGCHPRCHRCSLGGRTDTPTRPSLATLSARNTWPSAAAEEDLVAHQIDGTCAGLGALSRGELRKLFDLLAIGALRYVLTGVGVWNEASPDKLDAFLARWRASRFATLNAGSNVLVRLVAGSCYVIPATFASVGYPGPLEAMYSAVNA